MVCKLPGIDACSVVSTVATTSFGILPFTVYPSSTSVYGLFLCFGDGQRHSHMRLGRSLLVACVYFCRMRLVHIELSELERTRSFPYSSSLYAPKGTEDASLGHKDSLAQPSRFYAMASGLQDRQHLRGGVACPRCRAECRPRGKVPSPSRAVRSNL